MWSELVKCKLIVTGVIVFINSTRLLQSLGLILHRENAQANFLQTQYSHSNMEFSELLGAMVASSSNEYS